MQIVVYTTIVMRILITYFSNAPLTSSFGEKFLNSFQGWVDISETIEEEWKGKKQ